MTNITLLDGGMGQELLRRSSRPVTPMWSADIMLHEPHLVKDLHREFIESGARVITLNNYTATPQRLLRENAIQYMQSIHQKAIDAAQQAVKQSTRHDVKIAGCLPPLVASYRPEVSLSYDESLSSYRQLVSLQSQGCDLFICETMSSITEAKAACTAAKESNKPVWVAFTVKDEAPQQLRSGELLQDAITELKKLDPQAMLLNCSQPEAISACWPLINASENTVGAYANGFVSIASLYPGDTVEELEMRQDLSPQQYAEHAMHWVGSGASIIGGCCEIGPKHIKALHEQLKSAGFVNS